MNILDYPNSKQNHLHHGIKGNNSDKCCFMNARIGGASTGEEMQPRCLILRLPFKKLASDNRPSVTTGLLALWRKPISLATVATEPPFARSNEWTTLLI